MWDHHLCLYNKHRDSMPTCFVVRLNWFKKGTLTGREEHILMRLNTLLMKNPGQFSEDLMNILEDFAPL